MHTLNEHLFPYPASSDILQSFHAAHSPELWLNPSCCIGHNTGKLQKTKKQKKNPNILSNINGA